MVEPFQTLELVKGACHSVSGEYEYFLRVKLIMTFILSF